MVRHAFVITAALSADPFAAGNDPFARPGGRGGPKPALRHLRPCPPGQAQSGPVAAPVAPGWPVRVVALDDAGGVEPRGDADSQGEGARDGEGLPGEQPQRQGGEDADPEGAEADQRNVEIA